MKIEFPSEHSMRVYKYTFMQKVNKTIVYKGNNVKCLNIVKNRKTRLEQKYNKRQYRDIIGK